MKHPVLWIFRHVRRRIPGIVLLVLAQVGQALCSVFFALGSRGVIDSAVSGLFNFCLACKTSMKFVVAFNSVNCCTCTTEAVTASTATYQLITSIFKRFHNSQICWHFILFTI